MEAMHGQELKLLEQQQAKLLESTIAHHTDVLRHECQVATEQTVAAQVEQNTETLTELHAAELRDALATRNASWEANLAALSNDWAAAIARQAEENRVLLQKTEDDLSHEASALQILRQAAQDSDTAIQQMVELETMRVTHERARHEEVGRPWNGCQCWL